MPCRALVALLLSVVAGCAEGQPATDVGQPSAQTPLEAIATFAARSGGPLGEQLELDLAAAREGGLDELLALARRLDAHAAPGLAEPLYALLLSEEPGRPREAFLRARGLYELGRVEEALEALDGALALEPERAASHWRRGLWAAELGRFEEAERDFRRAIELDDNDPSASIGLARLLLDDGRPEPALAVLESLLERAPLLHAAHLADRARVALGQPPRLSPAQVVAPHHFADPWIDELVELRLGRGQELAAALDAIRGGREQDALALLSELLEERPDDVTVQGMYAAACARAGRPEDALPLLEAAAERSPRHYRIALNLSINLAASGRTEEAWAQARRAVELHPGHAAARYQLGRTSERTGRTAEAREAYVAALRYGYPASRVEPRLRALGQGGGQ